MYLSVRLDMGLAVHMTQDRTGFLPEEDFDTDPSSLVALVVGRTSADPLTEELHARGWDVRHCPGPGERRCPLLDTDRCELRERSDAAVIYVDGRGEFVGNEAKAFVRCGAHDASPVVAVIAGDYTILDPLEKTPVFAAGVSPNEVADAVERVHRVAYDDQ